MKANLSSHFTGTLALVLALAAVPPLQADVLVETATTVGVGDLALDGQRVVVSGTTLTLAGPHTFSALVLSNNAVLTHVPAPAGQTDQALRLTVTGDVDIDGTSRIDATGRGFAEPVSPGFGGNGSFAGGGGGHGGRGHRSNGNPLNSGGTAFGSVLAPDSWGGPGGNGDSTGALTPGGGLIHLEVGGELLIAGSIRADGSGARINNQGGAAGGTVYLKAGTLRGAGVISANGGPGEWVDGGGGAGGRIAVFYGINGFTGAITAYGAGGAGVGGAGTVYLKPNAATLGEVRIANGSPGEWTALESPAPFDLLIGANAVVYPPQPLSLGKVTLKEGGTLVQAAGTTNLVLTTTGDLVIESGGVLSADGRGYPLGGDRGPGAGVHNSWPGSGAGHGGWGANDATGAPGGRHYGSILQPVHMGSQGGDGDAAGTAGGGALRLQIGGTLTVNGRLSADGAGAPPNNAGGGSGGSIWITARAVAGEGVIRANGGPGEWVDGGGGAGGRIAFYFAQNDFAGTLTANGAGGSAIAGAGTIYTKGQAEAQGLLFIGNGGNDGNFTPLTSPEAFRVVLGGRANAYVESPLQLARLDIVGASRLSHLRGQTNLHVEVTGDLLIAADSSLNADGRGYPLGEDPGPGAGLQVGFAGSGGGHGGFGATSVSGAVGGLDYGSVLEPVTMGSQGGSGDAAGTAGGGAIRLLVGGKLSVLGRISSDGAVQPANNAGGGAGGSIWITANTLFGDGVIRAHGGPGEWVDGGGGAGGRIALYLANDTFGGTVTAYGGPARRGGAGTVYRRLNGETVGRLLVDNGGEWGNYTPLYAPEPYQLELSGHAYGFAKGALTLARLSLLGESVLVQDYAQTNVQLHILGDALISTNAQLKADGRGYPRGEDRGPGAGARQGFAGSGASHGGLGGQAVTGAVAGAHYGSILQPTLMGSQGGDGDGGAGTAGGGAIRLVVDGQLTVEGRLSANGAGSPPNNAGGGAGGSIFVTVGTLKGAGVISVNGGPGEWVDGGGGGGGRIALHFSTNEFAGAVTAYGGPARRGGAGTIYQRKTGSAFGQLLIHNGGVWGNYTPLTSPEPFQVTLAENAYLYPEGSLTLQDLAIGTNATLTHLSGQSRVELTVLNNLTVAEGGSLDVNGRGYQADGDRGPGGGQSAGPGGTGGGHGGVGATSVWGGVGGGIYDSIVAPAERGSAGGPGDGGPGGAGGGAIRLIVGNTLRADGRITANGLNGSANNSGGGAGGGIHITAARLEGTGIILADGGSGEWVEGGGGAGGRIALHLGSSLFNGSVQARGIGARGGGAGTVYSRLGTETGGELILDNAGNGGALSPLEVPPETRLVLNAGTFVYPPTQLSVVSLQLKSGATLTHPTGQANLAVHVAQNFIIESGAVVSVDGRGYPFNGDSGPGAGIQVTWGGSGGGHGGTGGVSASGASGGAVNGSTLQPIAWGSQGGFGDGGAGGAGGGAIKFRVGGTLDLAGTLTANGVNGTLNNSGGGAGGSIWIDAGRLAGAGVLTANGGAGEWVDGGGGSGGRIALYLGTNDFTGTLTAQGRGGRQAGAAGTIYARFDGESVGHLFVENGGTWGAYTPLTTPEPFDLTIANQAQVIPAEPLVVSSLTLETNTVLTHLTGEAAMQLVALGDALVNGAIDVSGRGYPWGEDVGPGGGVQNSWGGSGAGHGGAGGRSATHAPGGPAYGSILQPTALGSRGGSGDGGPGGAGGGAVRLIAGGTLTVNGSVLANGLNGTANNSGGGSGGSIFLSSQSFAGVGSLTANGGAGEWVDGGGGSGGRIAIYRSQNSFTGTLSAEGAGGAARGENGTIHQAEAPTVIWLTPAEGWMDGVVSLQVAALGSGSAPASMQFSHVRDGVATTIATVSGTITAEAQWNTLTVADGTYDLRVVVRDNSGRTLAEGTRRVLVNNSVIWHRGSLADSATWSAGKVHVVEGDFTIAANGQLTIEPGATVKFVGGSRFGLQSGATVRALGTAGSPVVLTSFLDDSVGGDSNLDGAESRPVPGAWRLVLQVGSTLEQNQFTALRYHSQSFGGVLADNQTTWTGDSLREVTETVVVPGGVTLTIEAGAILKFAAGAGIDINSGGSLVVNGTLAQPVIFTSARDDAYGGDTNGDGTRTKPAAGDWRSLRFQAGSSGQLNHAELRHGGNSVGNPWGAGGVIEALGGPLLVKNSVIADALKDGAFCYGTTRFENCLVLRCDRGLTAVGEMTILNCTLDANRIGLLEHVGQLIVRNTIVANSIDVGIEHDLGGGVPVVTHCNVFNPGASRGNYNGVSDRTGQDGNISLAPRYRNRELDNFRLNFASPGIDAASGTVAPVTDYAGVARFDDPRSGNTGVPAANGAVPDMGAFEFADNAPSNLDLVVESVTAPTQLTAGGLAHVEWTIVNRGSEAFSGPWHDALSLRLAGTTGKLPVSEILVGQNLTLGPGQSFRASADVRVPGGVNGSYQWVVSANSRGDLFEAANAANNETATEVAATLQVPVLVLDGGQISAQFVAQEERHWFAVTAPRGKDVRLNLDLLAASGITELYAGRGFVPTPDSFTSRQREWSSADTSVVVSGAGDATGPGDQNVFYVLAVGRALSTTPESYTLRASTADFTVERVKPATVGSAGLVTLEINGSKFSTNTVFAVRVGAERREAVRQSVRESGRVFATFNLDGLTPGPADVVAESDGLTVSLTGAVTVVAGGTPDFYVSLSGPATARAGRTMTWFVTYGNRGLVDLKLPLLKFSAPGATEIKLYESTLDWTDSFTFWALNPETLLPTFGPGQEVTFAVRVKASNSGRIKVEMMAGEDFARNATSFNWSKIPAPAGADTIEWSAMVNGLNNRLGATLGEYQALLEADLAELAVGELRYRYLANINGRWMLGEEIGGVPVRNPIIEIPPEEEDPAAFKTLPRASAKKAGDGIRKTWWVVITIQDYSNRTGNSAGNLNGTQIDFEDVRTYALTDLRVPSEQISGGHDAPGDNARWTKDFMLQELRAFTNKVDADDNLVIVYSGHGGRASGGTGYLVPNGRGAISPHAFTEAIDAVGAGTTYFINDSCHSEAFNELVNPANTTFVGFAATKKDRISWDTARGGELVSDIKGQLRKCHGLGEAFELTQNHVTKNYSSQANVVDQQSPVLTNPSGASLEGKPWNDPSGFEQWMDGAFRSPPFPGTVAGGTYTIVGSVDPNDKYALAGSGPEHWVQVGQVLPFEIVFENKTNAPAAAQEVLVLDDLDPRLDWSTFELKSLAFNDARIAVPPGLQRFTTTATVGTDTNEVVVDVSFNPATGRITWLMRSRDTATGELPEDPFAGFLPPNDVSRRGEGSLSYVIRPKADLADGTRLTNRATIIFDPTYGANPPIVTPMVTNAIDASLPTSAVLPLPAENDGTVEVQWTGTDAAGSSGIASFDIYVARDRGPYLLWQIATTATNAPFTGEPGSIYHFYSVARDAAGNTEAAPDSADAVTTVAGGYTYAAWAAGQNLPANAKGPDDDAEGDGLSNFAEYAYALNPLVADRALSVPKAAFATVNGQDYLTLTYRQPKTEPTDVEYRVTGSTALVPWAGLATTPVGAPVDRGTYVEVTVRAPAPAGGATAGFLRLELIR